MALVLIKLYASMPGPYGKRFKNREYFIVALL
uniref:Uncharacterized protein n=1 Tax=Anguilla anguilla TaxID=7936 RepID=A0A0E9PAN4_ANGAN